MKLKNVFVYFLLTVVTVLLTIFVYVRVEDASAQDISSQRGNQTLDASILENSDNPNFTYAAEHTIHAVVHVKSIWEREEQQRSNPLEFFFGPDNNQRRQQQQPNVGFGSGVILSADGYIVTNNHVIKDADKIEVTLNDQRTYTAELQGSDPNTDIALLKIDEEDLPYLELGNSEDVKIGDWVLAVGNPFGLTSSVTAGIISAKERSLGAIRQGEMPVESFLQTDAAVNVGNSGGALVNLDGKLIGIPTLILSPTRTNIGTAFAVPSSIVRRVQEDIIEYGEVRRGVLGITIRDVNSQLASEKGLEEIEGIFVQNTINGGAADEAGIQTGDVILEVNGKEVNSTARLQQEVSMYNPGEVIEITIKSNGETQTVSAELMSIDDYQDLQREQEVTIMGATMKMAPEDMLDQLNIKEGIQITRVESGKFQSAGIKAGFIILAINRQRVTRPAHVQQLLENYTGNVYIEGIYPDGTTAIYNLRLE